MDTLRFQPWQSVVEPAFWGKLGDVKLHQLKLDEGPLVLYASYTASNHASLPGPLTVSADSLKDLPPAGSSPAEHDAAAMQPAPEPAAPPRRPGCAVAGELHCFNTVERIAAFDREAATQRAAHAMWAAIESGAAERNPSLLQCFVLLAYCDLKHYRFHHWFGFPALHPPEPFALAQTPVTLSTHAELAAHGAEAAAACDRFFADAGAPPFWLLAVAPGGGAPTAHPLHEWDALRGSGSSAYLVAIDPSNAEGLPGWPLRNALLLAAARWGCPTLRVLCLRTRRGRFDPGASLILEVSLPRLPPGARPGGEGGWEVRPGRAEEPAPRVADLGSAMDPLQLAASAVDLNVLLMKWRAAPALDVGAMRRTRCLLLGAGTLGCSVARALLGWGVRRITFVDNSRVSYSNPARQSLFTFDDCLGGGRPKAAAAADALRLVVPGVEAEAVQLSIPMPGHPPAEVEVPQLLRDAEALAALVESHDVVFLLLDTREARWLPALLAAAHDKLAITAALGFDGFVVMRHGVGPAREAAQEEPAEAEAAGRAAQQALPAAAPRQRLGCYFCNDVVGPANSTRDRALDQQCTVARPGLSGIAGSLAAELMAAVVQHPNGAAAAAPSAAARGQDALALPLGDPPHMIRGQLHGFSQMCLTGHAFARCPACSGAAVRAYRSRGARFVLQAVSEPRYLEDLTGLTELHLAGEEADAELAAASGVAAGGGSSDDDEWLEL